MYIEESYKSQLNLLKDNNIEKYFFHYSCQWLSVENEITWLYFGNINDTNIRTSIILHWKWWEKDILGLFIKTIAELYKRWTWKVLFIAWHIDNWGRFWYDVVFERYKSLFGKDHIRIDNSKVNLNELKHFIEKQTIVLEHLILKTYSPKALTGRIKYVDLFNVNWIKTDGIIKGDKECLLCPVNNKVSIKNSLNIKVSAFIQIIHLFSKGELKVPYELKENWLYKTVKYIDPKDWLALIIWVTKEWYKAVKSTD